MEELGKIQLCLRKNKFLPCRINARYARSTAEK